MKTRVRSLLSVLLGLATLAPLADAAPAKSSSTKPPPAPAVPAVKTLSAELTISPREFGPSSSIELKFPTSMITEDKVGSKAETSPLMTIPPLAGEFEWTSTRTGLLRLKQAPKFDSSYRFETRPGLKDLEGNIIRAQKLKDINSERFRIVDQYPKWFSRNNIDRTPAFLLEFNDPVTPEAVAAGMAFKCEATMARIDVEVRHATGADFEKYGAETHQTWEELIAGKTVTLAKETVRTSAVVVKPVSPLTVGADWILDIATTIVNAGGTSKLAAGDAIKVGTVIPFQVRSIKAHTPFDRSRYLSLQFSRSLMQSFDSEAARKAELETRLAALTAGVHVEPAVADLKPKLEDGEFTLTGSFDLGKEYQVKVDPGLTSSDGLMLDAEYATQVKFEANPAYVSSPAYWNAMLASGKGEVEIAAANISTLEVRAKTFNGPELLQAVDKYKAYINASREDDKKRAEFKPTPLEEYQGEVVFEKTFTTNKPLDQSSVFMLNLKEILGKRPKGPVLLEFTGTALPGAPGGGTVVAQSLVEFTDIGLFQKDNFKSSTVFAVSLTTGAPLPGVRLTLTDADYKLLGYGETDANGSAVINGANTGFVLAELAGDATAMPVAEDEYDTTMSTWNFDINTAWQSPWTKSQRCFVFSDRSLYKPGDTAHLRALVRSTSGDDLSLPGKPQTATLSIRDGEYRLVSEREITFNANGSWAGSEALPAQGSVGYYHVSIRFPNAGRDSDDDSSMGNLDIRVDEYRPNTFEVKMDAAKVVIDPERIKVPLAANYLMGKPLSKAEIRWNANRTVGFVAPEAYVSYHFGDAPSWAHYAQDRDPEGDDYSNGEDEPYWDASGDLAIGEDGTATIELPTPPAHSGHLPQTVQIEAEVVDINEQTISASTSIVIPGAPFLVGLKSADYFAYAGKAASFEAVALTSAGKPHQAEVPVKVKLERQSYNIVRVETAGGGTSVKHQVILTPELEQDAVLKPAADGQPASLHLDITPKAGGVYFLTVEAAPAQPGQPTAITRHHFYSIGGGEFPWSMNDGTRIDLHPEKTQYKAGEEATIVVKSPIAGDAIVSVERNKVHSHFRTRITAENPLIKIPLTDVEAPNCFVSVIIIRGAQDSTQAVKMPEYRFGYCQLNVESAADVLGVKVSPDRPTVLPGDMVTATALITDHAGQPLPQSEVTLWAVDEGVLSLMGYETPDPVSFFHAPAALAVRNRTNFGTIMTEDATKRWRGNKGFVIGGGDGDSNLPEASMRKNFVATPLWSQSLTTDDKGAVTATFKAPDNLSRFRLMAVAAHGARRFGSGQSSVTVNKPLMIQPAVPRFARLDDEFLIKGIVHNTTAHGGTVDVTLTLDDHAAFITEHKPFILTALATNTDKPNGNTWTRSVTLKPNETASIAFPVRLTKLGELTWTWSATTAKWSDATALNDKVETKFNVEHPVPENREIRYYRITGGKPSEDLVKDLSPVLLEGDGTLSITASTSQLYDVRDALDYVLTYPYGCVEQTSSSTLPWLALGGYSELFPEHLSPAKTKDSIQQGVNRLLQMVTDRGGLGYWPGAEEPSLWGSAYGGFILLKARDAGATVPKEVIDELLDYLSKELRHLDDEKSAYILTDSCMAAYTLAKGGKAEPAYHNILYNHRDRIPTRGKLFLALAMLISNDGENQVRTLLGVPPNPAAPAAKKASGGSGSYVFDDWFGDRINTALRLIAYTHLGMKAEAQASVDKILASRNKQGEWGNTFTNAWTLQAMAAYERSINAKPQPLSVDLVWGEQSLKLDLPQPNSIAKGGYVLSQQLSTRPLTVNLPADRQVILRIEAKSWSKLRDFAGVNNGYGLARSYHKLNPDGTTGPIDDLRVGDQVLVRLDIETPGGDRYLAINDPLPAVFEAINPEFKTQNADVGPVADMEPWFCDHRELRTDRALFFTDFSPGKGKFTLAYQARVISEGEVIAPSARIEAMYEPTKNGISATTRLRTLPNPNGKKVAAGN